jgi:hypothetical protein
MVSLAHNEDRFREREGNTLASSFSSTKAKPE